MRLLFTILRVLLNVVAAVVIVTVVSVMAAVVSFALVLGGRLGYEASASIHNSIWEQTDEVCANQND